MEPHVPTGQGTNWQSGGQQRPPGILITPMALPSMTSGCRRPALCTSYESVHVSTIGENPGNNAKRSPEMFLCEVDFECAVQHAATGPVNA